MALCGGASYLSVFWVLKQEIAKILCSGQGLSGVESAKIIDKLKDGTFQAAFADKGRFSNFLAEIPVYLILEENTPLLGAAHLALRRTLA